MRLDALFRLAFTSAPGFHALNLAAHDQLVGSLCKRHAVTALMPLRQVVGVRFQVLFHSAVRGPFHLSLTVLVRYRSPRSIQPCRMVPAASRRIPRVPRYSGGGSRASSCRYGALTLRGADFHLASRSTSLALCRSYYPARAVTRAVWAPPVPLAATPGITFVFFSSAYLDVSVQRVRTPRGVASRRGCPIRISADLRSFAPPRGFSQLIASFFASWSLGILRTPFSTSSPAPLFTASSDSYTSCQCTLRPLRPRGHSARGSGVSSSLALQKGGVPAAPSGTATLLRLSPSHPFHP